VGFILLVSGFVVSEILSEWPVSKAILKWVPLYLCDILGITGPMAKDFVYAIVIFIIFPAVLFLAVGTLAKIRSEASSGAIAKSFALLLLPTMAGAHLIKAIFKMTSRIPYWPGVFSDPTGVETATKIFYDKTLVLNKSVPNALYPIISFAAAAMLLIALLATLLIFRKSPVVRNLHSGAKVPLLLGVLVYWGVFGVTVFKWRF
jgi:hypothetical protein